MLKTIQNQLTELAARTGTVLQSVESMLMHGKRPATVLVAVTTRGRHVGSVPCDRGYQSFAGTIASAAVCPHAGPVTEGWRPLDFAKTNPGTTGHSQSSRFAT